MAKSIRSFLPKYEVEEGRINADIGVNLRSKANKLRKAMKLTWAQLLTGLIEKYVQDLWDIYVTQPKPSAPGANAYVTKDDQINMFGYDPRMVK